MNITLKINGSDRLMDIKPGDTLYDTLKIAGINSVKKSCGSGCCGSCTVLIDGKPVPSCIYLAIRAEGHSITTAEGALPEVEKFAKFLNSEGAVQCGYCSPGFALTVIAMKNELNEPSDDDIKDYLEGNLCRCSGYMGQMRAVKKYLGVSE